MGKNIAKMGRAFYHSTTNLANISHTPMRTPYIGITDFMDADQVRAMLDVFLKNGGPDISRKLHVGVMTSRKILNGIETRWKNAMPAKEKVASIFTASKHVFNVLHYADPEGVEVAENLERATAYGYPHMHALQLDMIWPPIDALRHYRTLFPTIQLIFQANAAALAKVNNDPEAFVARLKPYEGIITYVLLDKSSGQGIGMNAAELLPFIRALASNFAYTGSAIAGGLGPDTMHLALPIIRKFPHISIDAQGRLRPSGSALDPIDWTMARIYLERSLAMFHKYYAKPERPYASSDAHPNHYES